MSAPGRCSRPAASLMADPKSEVRFVGKVARLWTSLCRRLWQACDEHAHFRSLSVSLLVSCLWSLPSSCVAISIGCASHVSWRSFAGTRGKTTHCGPARSASPPKPEPERARPGSLPLHQQSWGRRCECSPKPNFERDASDEIMDDRRFGLWVFQTLVCRGGHPSFSPPSSPPLPLALPPPLPLSHWTRPTDSNEAGRTPFARRRRSAAATSAHRCVSSTSGTPIERK